MIGKELSKVYNLNSWTDQEIEEYTERYRIYI